MNNSKLEESEIIEEKENEDKSGSGSESQNSQDDAFEEDDKL